MADREPPNDVNAEAGLLAVFLHQKEDKALTECLDSGLSPDMFFNKKFELIAWVCWELYADVRPINKENIVALLKELGKLDEAGGEATISELEKRNDYSDISASYYIEIIKEKAFRRKLIETAIKAVEANLPDKATNQEIADTVASQSFLPLGENTIIEGAAEAKACRKLVHDKVRELFAESKKRGFDLRGTLRLLTRLVERLNKRARGE